jgi:hypothetical protein
MRAVLLQACRPRPPCLGLQIVTVPPESTDGERSGRRVVQNVRRGLLSMRQETLRSGERKVRT